MGSRSERPPPKTAEQYARQVMANKTFRSYSPQHGTQLEYNAPDGRTYLWYPGNAVVLEGRWRVEPDPHAPKLLETPPGSGNIVEGPPRFRRCYQYGSNTYNPVTGRRGGEWECQGVFSQGLGQPRGGDVFGLARRKTVPMVTTKQRYTYEELLAALRSR